MIAWLLYTVLVSALLGLAALACEAALWAAGRPSRWSWAAAMCGSLVLPLVAWLRPEEVVARGVAAPASPAVAPATLLLDVAVPAASASWDGWVLAGWATLSLAVLVVVVLAHARLVAARRRWDRERVDGVAVYVSRDVGPAALGFFGGAIVIPEWALRLEARLRRLMLLHESEHVRAGDPRLVWLGLAAVLAMPWNPVVWWQLRRLRLAIEMDCDARVMRSAPDAQGYGTLLLEVGRRHSVGRLLAAALAEPRSSLERRLDRLLGPKPRGWMRPAALAVAAVGLVALACEAPEPMVPFDGAADGEARAGSLLEEAQKLATGTARSTPEECPALYVVDGEVVGEARRGDPAFARIETLDPSTIERIDVIKGVAAAGVAKELGADAACAVVRIETKSAAAAAPVSSTPIGDGYVAYTPEMERPSLLNAEEVARALERHYPTRLRAAGIGGTVMMRFWIDAAGVVTRREVTLSSGYPALDEAAAAVAEVMEFTPARAGGAPQAVVVEIPITFRTSAPERSSANAAGAERRDRLAVAIADGQVAVKGDGMTLNARTVEFVHDRRAGPGAGSPKPPAPRDASAQRETQ
ncbi:MAG TPA: TonB family protein [Longimicrobiales bacterium]